MEAATFGRLDQMLSVIVQGEGPGRAATQPKPIFFETEKITVGKNPGKVVADETGNIYTIARGDYGQTPSKLVKISNNQVETIYPWEISGISSFNNNFILIENGGSNSTIQLFDPISESITSENFIETSSFTTLYNIQYIPEIDKVFVFDANGYTESGQVYEYNASGQYVTEYDCTIIPKKLIYHD